jgi:hypothetical protein
MDPIARPDIRNAEQNVHQTAKDILIEKGIIKATNPTALLDQFTGIKRNPTPEIVRGSGSMKAPSPKSTGAAAQSQEMDSGRDSAFEAPDPTQYQRSRAFTTEKGALPFR